MGELVPFPLPKHGLTRDELIEYWEIRSQIEQAESLREIRICNQRIDEFIFKINKKYDSP